MLVIPISETDDVFLVHGEPSPWCGLTLQAKSRILYPTHTRWSKLKLDAPAEEEKNTR
jgi:hypothetical protein